MAVAVPTTPGTTSVAQTVDDYILTTTSSRWCHQSMTFLPVMQTNELECAVCHVLRCLMKIVVASTTLSLRSDNKEHNP